MVLPLTVPDLLCLDDLDELGGETTSDLQSLEQDVFHILVEVMSSNVDDLDRGLGLDRMLSGDTRSLSGITHTIDAQLRKDSRIDSATSSLTQLDPGALLPDGTTLEQGGYLLELDIGASESVLGLSYSYTPDGGLVSQ